MINNKFLLWLNIVLFLGLLLLFFEMKRQEADIYNDPVLQYFGVSKEKIVEQYGKPDFRGEIGGPGGEVLFYKELGISFIFAGDGSVVNNLELFPGKELLGVRVGMTFDEITKVMGKPRNRTYDSYEEDYIMTYYLGEEKNEMGEIEIWFSASQDDAPTKKVQIFWKKYWR